MAHRTLKRFAAAALVAAPLIVVMEIWTKGQFFGMPCGHTICHDTCHMLFCAIRNGWLEVKQLL